MTHRFGPAIRRGAGVAALASVAALVLSLGVDVAAAHAGPVAPPVVGYTYASFVVPSRAQNGGAAYMPVQGMISGAGSSFALKDYSMRMLCHGTSFYPLNLTTYGGGSISFSGLVPMTESGHTCTVNASSALPGQRIDFQPSQMFLASEVFPTAVVNIYAQIINRSAAGGL